MSLMRNPRFTSLLQTKLKPQICETRLPLRFILNPRYVATVGSEISGEKWSFGTQKKIRNMVQVAMLEYFYCTRGLQFLVAESMSKNAPAFNDKILKKLNCDGDDDADIAKLIARQLRFHPINEFEPFLESLGLKPSDYTHLLPPDKMFLNEDGYLLENYHTFWNYGIGLKKMGKIFKEARQVFGYETSVLASKIQAYEDLELRKSFVSKLIVCSPRILTGNMNLELVNVLKMVKSMEFEVDWVMENLSEEVSYDWSSINRALSFLKSLCFDENELRELLKKRPKLVFEDSGVWTLFLAGFATKLGSSKTDLSLFFQKFPQIQVQKSALNLRHCFFFLIQIEMEADEISKIFRLHSFWLCTHRLKQASTLLSRLNVGTTRLCRIIKENPEEMKKWAMGLRVQPLPCIIQIKAEKSKIMKIQFLLNLGFKENSKEMERAIKNFCGRGSRLQQRFDFLISLGLNETEVRYIVKSSPKTLSQASDVVEAKVKYINKELGYPLSTFVAFPSCLCFSLQRMKLRLWVLSCLEEKGKVISTLLVKSDEYFESNYVNPYPERRKHWEDLKKQLLYE